MLSKSYITETFAIKSLEKHRQEVDWLFYNAPNNLEEFEFNFEESWVPSYVDSIIPKQNLTNVSLLDMYHNTSTNFDETITPLKSFKFKENQWIMSESVLESDEIMSNNAVDENYSELNDEAESKLTIININN